jgi:hypothetical protein
MKPVGITGTKRGNIQKKMSVKQTVRTKISDTYIQA